VARLTAAAASYGSAALPAGGAFGWRVKHGAFCHPE